MIRMSEGNKDFEEGGKCDEKAIRGTLHWVLLFCTV